MKILWVSNSPIGPAAQILQENYQGSSGGWIQSEYEKLDKGHHEMYFLCTERGLGKGQLVHKTSEIGEVFCIGAPRVFNGVKNPPEVVAQVDSILEQITPDVIHIWGTETCLSNIVANSKCKAKKVVFIQGLIGVHARYLNGYFYTKENKKFCRGAGIVSKLRSKLRKTLFERQVAIERDTIIKCKNVIVDSDFSVAYCRSLGADITCFKHVLTPNQIFYEHTWDLTAAEPHSIFTVYGSTAEKGLQQLLKAVAIVKRHYPDLVVKIPGPFPTDGKGHLWAKGSNEFEVVLNNMISHFGLQDNVRFLGRLDVTGMAEEICHSHIFVNPSCMEVHALSLREAMTEGVPSVSSLCGGVGDLITHAENGMIYRYEEYELLALYIDKIFSDDAFALHLSQNARQAVENMKGKDEQSLTDIYSTLINGEKCD